MKQKSNGAIDGWASSQKNKIFIVQLTIGVVCLFLVFITPSGISSKQNGSRELDFRSLIEKQRIVTMTLSAHRISTEDRRENIDRMIYQIENLEQEKVQANSNYDQLRITCYYL